MKKRYVFLLALLSVTQLWAQDAYDAWKFAQQDLLGTARYVGLAGAFAPLGGDPSAVKDNPAGLGVFRNSDISVTLDLNWVRTYSNWGGDDYTARAFRLSGAQVNWVHTFKTSNAEVGLVSNSLMFGYHRLKNYAREVQAVIPMSALSLTDYMADFSYGLTESQMGQNAFDNINLPWLTIMGYEGYVINPDTVNIGLWNSVLNPNEAVAAAFASSESGWQDEYNVAWGGNWSNKFYLGASFAVRVMQYSKNVTYSEAFSQGGSFEFSSNYEARGIGLNGVIGFIYRPINMLRLALSVQTPTLNSIREWSSADIYSWGLTQQDIHVASPQSEELNYQVSSPWRITAGVATTFSNVGLVSLQFDYETFRTMHFRSNSGSSNAWNVENNQIKNVLGNALTVRLGTEWFVTNNFALRAGVMHKFYGQSDNMNRILADNSVRTDVEFGKINNQTYLTAGLGVRNNFVLADIAYQFGISHEQMSPFSGMDLFDLKALSHRIVFTFGIK